ILTSSGTRPPQTFPLLGVAWRRPLSLMSESPELSEPPQPQPLPLPMPTQPAAHSLHDSSPLLCSAYIP
ncbi:hypothetical protein E4U53_005208, partial [Claviceps sorghi]